MTPDEAIAQWPAGYSLRLWYRPDYNTDDDRWEAELWFNDGDYMIRSGATCAAVIMALVEGLET